MLGGEGGGKSWKRREFYFLFSVNVMTLSNSRIKEIYDYKPLVSLKLKSKSLPLGAKCRMLYLFRSNSIGYSKNSNKRSNPCSSLYLKNRLSKSFLADQGHILGITEIIYHSNRARAKPLRSLPHLQVQTMRRVGIKIM